MSEISKQKLLDFLKDEKSSCRLVGDWSDRSIIWECNRIEERINAGMFEDPTVTDYDKQPLINWIDQQMSAMGNQQAYSYQMGIYRGYKMVKEQLEKEPIELPSNARKLEIAVKALERISNGIGYMEGKALVDIAKLALKQIGKVTP